MKPRILVVDRDEPTSKDIVRVLATAEYRCRKAANRAEVLALFQAGEEFDLMLAGATRAQESEALLAATKERFPDMPVVMVTAVHDVSVARSAIRNGAFDYLVPGLGDRGSSTFVR